MLPFCPRHPARVKAPCARPLVNRGWRLLSDELALVRVSDGKIIPLPRPVSLKNESIDIIQRYEPDAIFSRKVSDTMKGTVAHMKVPTDSIAHADGNCSCRLGDFPEVSGRRYHPPGSSASIPGFYARRG